MKYHSTGDFNIKECSISTYKGERLDISLIFSQLNIYESLFDNTLSGSITLIDSLGLIEGLPIIGEETLTIKLERLENVIIDRSFKVYKISNRTKLKDHSEIYTLQFISFEEIYCMDKIISRSYTDMKISNMIDNIFSNFIKTDKPKLIEPTKYIRSFIIPNLTPFESINWLNSQAISMQNYGTGYIAYEDLDGFKVLSLETLAGRPSLQSYHHSIANMLSPGSGSDRTELDIDRTSIIQLQMLSNNDVLKNIKSGAFTNLITSFNPVKKTYKIDNFYLKNSFDKFKNINSNKLNSNKFVGFNSISNGRFVVDDESFPIEYMQNRISQINRFLGGQSFIMTIPGDRRRVGEKVTMNFNSNIPDKRDENDNLISGDYILTKIRHNIKPSVYLMECEIARDSGIVKL